MGIPSPSREEDLSDDADSMTKPVQGDLVSCGSVKILKASEKPSLHLLESGLTNELEDNVGSASVKGFDHRQRKFDGESKSTTAPDISPEANLDKLDAETGSADSKAFENMESQSDEGDFAETDPGTNEEAASTNLDKSDAETGSTGSNEFDNVEGQVDDGDCIQTDPDISPEAASTNLDESSSVEAGSAGANQFDDGTFIQMAPDISPEAASTSLDKSVIETASSDSKEFDNVERQDNIGKPHDKVIETKQGSQKAVQFKSFEKCAGEMVTALLMKIQDPEKIMAMQVVIGHLMDVVNKQKSPCPQKRCN